MIFIKAGNGNERDDYLLLARAIFLIILFCYLPPGLPTRLWPHITACKWTLQSRSYSFDFENYGQFTEFLATHTIFKKLPDKVWPPKKLLENCGKSIWKLLCAAANVTIALRRQLWKIPDNFRPFFLVFDVKRATTTSGQMQQQQLATSFISLVTTSIFSLLYHCWDKK